MNSMGSMGGIYNNFLQVMSEQIQSFCTALLPYETVLHTMHIICMYLSFAVRVLLFAFSNYIYYRFVLRKVHRIRAEGLPEGMTKDRLRMAGGTNYWFVLIAILAQYAVTAKKTEKCLTSRAEFAIIDMLSLLAQLQAKSRRRCF